MRNHNNLVGLMAGLLSILLLIGVVGFVLMFTNGLNEDFKSFYLEYNGEIIAKTDSKKSFEEGKEHKFLCKYHVTPEDISFNVKVLANEDVNFEYTVGGEIYNFADNKDLSRFFTINVKDGYFTLGIPASCSLEHVLKVVHGVDDVVIPDTISSDSLLYTLQVSSYNNKVTYNIDFNTFVKDAHASSGSDLDNNEDLSSYFTVWYVVGGVSVYKEEVKANEKLNFPTRTSSNNYFLGWSKKNAIEDVSDLVNVSQETVESNTVYYGYYAGSKLVFKATDILSVDDSTKEVCISLELVYCPASVDIKSLDVLEFVYDNCSFVISENSQASDSSYLFSCFVNDSVYKNYYDGMLIFFNAEA